MSELLANQLMDQNDSLRAEIDGYKVREGQLAEEFRLLFGEVKRFKARKKRLLSDNRKLRGQVKKLKEELAAARQQLRNFQKNTAKNQSSGSPFLLDAAGGR